MVENEGVEDCKMGSPDLSQGTSARSGIIDMMSWGIESKITHNLEIG